MRARLARIAAESAGTIDDRGGAQPAFLAVADIDRGHADRRRLQNAAGGVADHGVGEPQRGPVALAAERGEEKGAVRPRRDKGLDRVVDGAIARIGVDAGEDDAAVLDLGERAEECGDIRGVRIGLRRGRMQRDQQEALRTG